MSVGFEWQSAPQRGEAKQYFPKNTVLRKGLGWKLVTDGADMEFVTDPIPLNLKTNTDLGMDGETTLLSVMRSIELVCEDLDEHREKASFGKATPNVKRNLLKDFPDPCVIVPQPPRKTLSGFAQVSAGVRMGKLREFF